MADGVVYGIDAARLDRAGNGSAAGLAAHGSQPAATDCASVNGTLTIRLPVRDWFDAAAPGVFRFVVVRAGGDGPVVDDLMQQLWIAANRSPDRVSRAEAETWLRTVAKRLLITHWRREGVRAAVPLDDPGVAANAAAAMLAEPGVAAGGAIDQERLRQQLRLAMTELESEDQDLLIGHYVKGMSQADLGKGLGLSERAIEGRLYRARRALRSVLEGMGLSGHGAMD